MDAPFGIYSPGEIPAEYHSQIMESGKAYQWRNDGRITSGAFVREVARLENQGELTVSDMARLSREGGADMNIRIAMAKVGNDFRFVGYDMSQGGPGGSVHTGFVESEKGTTSGVGRALFADRVTRALLNQASGMNLEVYTSQRTADFHAQVFAVAGREGAPTEGTKYRLTTGEMARLAVAWNSRLTPTQVSNLLNALLAQGGNVNPADAELRCSTAPFRIELLVGREGVGRREAVGRMSRARAWTRSRVGRRRRARFWSGARRRFWPSRSRTCSPTRRTRR